MRSELSRKQAARIAAYLFIASGVLSALALPLPQLPGINRPAVVALSAAAIVAGVVAYVLPWDRWRREMSAVILLPLAFLIIGLGNYFGSARSYSYSVFFIVAFAWIGIAQPRWTSLWFAPLASVAYVAPILYRSKAAGAADASAGALAIPVCILVAEIIAWVVDAERRARQSAQTLARISHSLARHLSVRALSQSLVDEARAALNSDHCVLFQIDPETKTVSSLYASGVEDRFIDVLNQLRGVSYEGFSRLDTLLSGQAIVIEDTDYSTEDDDLRVRYRVKSHIQVPVLAQGELVGLLWCAESSRKRRYTAQEIELADAIAGQMGAAFQNARLYEKTLEAARQDSMTNLGNRRAFRERLESEVERARRHRRMLSLVLLDADALKNVNDGWGHLAGDRVLGRLAALLDRQRRAEDGAYRVGGDEFALILPETPSAGASILAERLRRRIQRERLGVGDDLHLTVSIGVGSFPEHAVNADELFERADSALYEVKRSGGNAVAIAGPRDAGPGMKCGIDIRKVIEDGRLVAVYQPIFDLREHSRGAVLGYETFCRLDPALGPTPTPSLFRAAGTMGLVAALDRRCRTMAIRGAAMLPADKQLFVNMSPAALQVAGFDPIEIAAVSDGLGLRRDQIVLEVIEQERTAASKVLATNLELCREAGLKIALDDFGAASADLDLLALVSFDYVKIDMSFVHGANGVETRRRLLQSLQNVAVGVGATVIAEGIESLDDLKLVKELGFYAAQGFFLREPGTTLDETARPLDLLKVGEP
jgi:diguanylate cyclase (GGDEF)-like protein